MFGVPESESPEIGTNNFVIAYGVPELKWENVSMDFSVGLSRMMKGHTMIWVIINRLTKSVHFIPSKPAFTVYKWAQIYMKEVVSYTECQFL